MVGAGILEMEMAKGQDLLYVFHVAETPRYCVRSSVRSQLSSRGRHTSIY